MAAFDYVILGVLLASGLLGLMRGLLKEIFSLLAYILSFLAEFWGTKFDPHLVTVY